MQVVVVGIDGSGHAREALRAAVAEAAWRGVGVVAVHVVHHPVSFGFSPSTPIDWSMLEDAGRAALDHELALVEGEHPGGFPIPVRSLVRTGHVGTQLACLDELVDDIDPVLTVVGTRGYGAVKGMLLGSTTSYLVHHLTTPLLVVPVTSEESADSDLSGSETVVA